MIAPEKVIQEIRRIIQEVMLRKNDNTVGFPKEFFLTQALERLATTLESIDVLREASLARHDHAVGLLFRNILSDFLTISYVFRPDYTDQSVEQDLYALIKLDVDKGDRYVSDLKKAGLLNSQDEQNHIQRTSQLKMMIDDYYKTSEPTRFPFMNQIGLQALSGKLNPDWSKKVQVGYDLWLYYSKYEHIGFYSYDLTRDDSPDYLKKRTSTLMRISSLLLYMCLNQLQENISKKAALRLLHLLGVEKYSGSTK